MRFLPLLFLYAFYCFSTQAEIFGRFLPDEKEAMTARHDLMALENKEILAAVHIWDNNKLGLLGLAGLMEAAKRGAKVRLVTDGLGAWFWNKKAALYPALVKALQEAGVEIRIYKPVTQGLSLVLNPPVLERLHDKLIYFGSEEIVLTGDRNFQNANFIGGRQHGKPTNSYLSAEGLFKGPPAVEAKRHIEEMFALAEPMDTSKVTKREVEFERRKLERIASAFKKGNRAPESWVEKLQPLESLDFISDKAITKGLNQNSEDKMIALIDRAQSHITMTIPFWNLSVGFERALIRAAKDRGVEVRLIGSGQKINHNDDASLPFWPQEQRLRNQGIRTYKHTGQKWLHAKLLEVDGKEAYVGSHNFNPRSNYTDLESGFIMRSPKMGEDVSQFLNGLIKNASVPYERKKLNWRARCYEFWSRLGRALPVLGRQF